MLNYEVSVFGYYVDIVTTIMLPLLALSIPFSTKVVRFKNDFSYGIYLYHWCVLNLMIEFSVFEKVSDVIALLIFTVGTLGFAFISWNVVERKFLKKYRRI